MYSHQQMPLTAPSMVAALALAWDSHYDVVMTCVEFMDKTMLK